MTDVVWVLNQTQTLCVILMLRTDSIAFPSGEGGAPQGVTDEENVSARPSLSGELFAPQKRRLMEAGLPARIVTEPRTN